MTDKLVWLGLLARWLFGLYVTYRTVLAIDLAFETRDFDEATFWLVLTVALALGSEQFRLRRSDSQYDRPATHTH